MIETVIAGTHVFKTFWRVYPYANYKKNNSKLNKSIPKMLKESKASIRDVPNEDQTVCQLLTHIQLRCHACYYLTISLKKRRTKETTEGANIIFTNSAKCIFMQNITLLSYPRGKRFPEAQQ